MKRLNILATCLALHPDPFSPFLSPRTRGPLGRNDAADPPVNAYPGDTPGSLGVNDGSAWPARILQIRNMEGYQYGGDKNKFPPALQWYAKGSTDYHEEVHNQQFCSWLKKNTFFILRNLEQKAGDRLKNLTHLIEKDVVKAAQEATKSLIPEGYGDGDADEKEAYTKTYQKIWVPLIQTIKANARKAGWK